MFDADNERLGLVAEYDHPLLGRMRQFGSSSTSRRRPARSTARRRSSASTRWRSSSGSATPQADMDELESEGVVYWPDDNYAWTVLTA